MTCEICEIETPLRIKMQRAIMTWERWCTLPPAEKDCILDTRALSSQLIGLEGQRVKVLRENGESASFIVGRSTGWKPIHLEIKTKRSRGGERADKYYSNLTIRM